MAQGGRPVAGLGIMSGGWNYAAIWFFRMIELLVTPIAWLIVIGFFAFTARDVVFSDADFLLESVFGTSRFGLRLAPPPAFAAPVDVRGEFRPPAFGRKSDYRRWSGEVFAQVDYVDLAQLNQWIHAPIDVHRANGAMRMWIRFDDADVIGATADNKPAIKYRKWGVDNTKKDEYWFDSRIHTLGNCGFMGAVSD